MALRLAFTFTLLIFYTSSHAELSSTMTVDNQFEVYLSTDDSVQGNLITSGDNWTTTYDFTAELKTGQDYYLHIHARDTGGPAAFLGEFTISGSEHVFANSSNELVSNTTDWSVSLTGWADYVNPSDYGPNGSSPWGNRFANINSSARWIWSSDNQNHNEVFFTTKISATQTCKQENTLTTTGIKIGSGGADTNIGTTTEGQSIFNAWIDAGSPETGLIDGGTYNVTTSAVTQADKIDFGGQERSYSGTLPYPFDPSSVGSRSHEHFIVHAMGTVSLPAGDYTIFAQTDDGFSLTLDTISGDPVNFNKFGGGSSAGNSNELRFERPTGNSATGGSFTLTQDSVFTISAIFFERTGNDYMEIGIVNSLTSSRDARDYEVFAHDAMDGALQFSSCIEPEPDPEPVLLAEYRFEDKQYDGTAGEVKDSSGNDHHGVVNTSSRVTRGEPALTGNPGTCSYLSQNNGKVEISGLPVDTSVGAKTTVTFWMKWDGTTNVMPMGWNFHDIWIASGLIGFNTFMSDIRGVSSTGLEDTWVHIAAVFTNGDVFDNKLYINGIEQTLSQLNTPNNSRAYVNSELRIGGAANSEFFNFFGLLDEFRVYDGALSEAQINEIMDERQPCELQTVHHYEIIHDAQALTCDAEEVIVRACANANCSELYELPINLELIGNSNIKANVTFTGSDTVSFNHTTAETLTLSLANASVDSDNSLQCIEPSGSSCDMIFTDAGFRFLYGASNNTSIDNQISGNMFSDSLKIQAVENNNGVCEALFSGNKTVELSQQNIDPAGTPSLDFTVNGVSLAKHPLSSSIQLNFDASSIATISSPLYNDAGLIRLHASYSENGVNVEGSSNSFWVAPARFEVSASAGLVNLDGDSASNPVTYPAGEDFQLNIQAMNSKGVVTQNYEQGQLQFQLTRTGPTLVSAANGRLRYANGQSIASSLSANFQDVPATMFVKGVSTYSNAHYSEVGLIQLQVRDVNYGNQGIVVSSAATDIGRFTPHHFTQSIADTGMLQATCDSRMSLTAYSGQLNGARGAIKYMNAPILEITAYNKQGEITQNYYQDSEGSANDFMKLDASMVLMTAPSSDQVALGANNLPLPISANLNTGTLSQNDLTQLPNSVPLPRGVLHYQFSSNDHFVYSRSANSEVAPFTSNMNFAVNSIVDSDNIVATGLQSVTPTGLEIRFGRMIVENSFGPETHSFPQVLSLEHYDGSQYVLSSDNNCVDYDPANISLNNISLNPALTSIVGTNGVFANGVSSSLTFSPTGEGNQGQIGVEYNAPDWLKFDWDTDGNFDNNPTGIATFGVYRGDDRLHHWREGF